MVKITIVGSGTAGSLTSAFLAKEFPNATVEMIHSEKVGIIGVGESLTPHFPTVLEHLGVDEKKFMRETGAVFKYGNNMEDWTNTPQGPDVFRTFYWSNQLGKEFTWKNISKTNPNHVRTVDAWLDVYRNNSAPDLNVYQHNSESYQYCKDLKMPFDDEGCYLMSETQSYAYHIDAEKTSPWIRENVCKNLGVIETVATVVHVNTDAQGIQNVILDNGRKVVSDVWIDCTGLNRILINKLTTKFHTYKANKVNSAWVCPIEYEDKNKEQVNYTRSIRRDLGWQFSIALNNRIGTGLVYSDEYFSDDQALEHWHSIIKGRQIREPRKLKWTPGRLVTPNVGNCFAIGMAAGFIDPLEANAVVSAIAGMKHVVRALKENKNKNYYNDKINYYFDDIADFTAVHYTLSRHGNNHFWKDMRRIGKELDHENLVKEKFYKQANSMEGIRNYLTAFPDANWLDIANNWIQKLNDWPTRTTAQQQQKYVEQVREIKLKHSIQSNNNKKSIDEFMKTFNNEQQHNDNFTDWPKKYYKVMYSENYKS